MSEITKPVLLDDTGKEMIDVLRQQNALLQVLASDKFTNLYQNYKSIQRIVKSGLAENVFNIGDQIIVP